MDTIPLFLAQAPLGKKTACSFSYTPSLLFPIARAHTRQELRLGSELPFHGTDIWTGYEISWLNEKGKPLVAGAIFRIPCSSPYLIESKSLKLYLYSLSQTSFESINAVQKILIDDLSHAAQAPVEVTLLSLDQLAKLPMQDFKGKCLDDLDIDIHTYETDPNLLKTYQQNVEETVFTHLFKSNCLKTGQPDWGTLFIRYFGNQIDHQSLLQYLISFRNHSGFGEQCVEKIFMDLQQYCKPMKLTVYGRYTRRGGLDINPFRSNFESAPHNIRLARQ